jgi:hypothetical protein
VLVALQEGQLMYTAMPTSTYQYNPVPTTLTFTSVGFPVTNTAGSPLCMASGTDLSTLKDSIYIIGPGLSQMLCWNGTTVAVVSGAPAGSVIRWHQNRMYMVSADGRTVYYSGMNAPGSWASGNSFKTLPEYGRVVGLESHPGLLIMFCEGGILGLDGDPGQVSGATSSSPNYYVYVLHDKIGCDVPSSISTLGNSTAFFFRNDAYIFTDAVKLISDKVSGWRPVESGTDQYTSAVLTPQHYVVGAPGGAAGWAMHVLDRERFGYWTHWVYPTIPMPPGCMGMVAAPDGSGIYCTDNAGNLYVQPLRRQYQDMGASDAPLYTPDPGGGMVTATLRTRRMEFGGVMQTKKLRQVTVYGAGSAGVTLTVRTWNLYGAETDYTVTAGILPYTWRPPNAGTGCVFAELEVEVTGGNLWVQGIDVDYTPLRYLAGNGGLMT